MSTRCKDCQKETCDHHYGKPFGKDYYMVQHGLWYTYGVGSGMLCIDCLEKRVGRRLSAADFLDCPLNRLYNPYTMRLFDECKELSR